MHTAGSNRVLKASQTSSASAFNTFDPKFCEFCCIPIWIFVSNCTHTCSQSADDSPTLPELLRFPVQDEFKDVVVEIQSDYLKFGIQLLQDDTGNTIEGIERKKRGDPSEITVEIFRLWLQGKGRQPVAWKTLVNCLQDANLHVTADYIQSELDTGDILIVLLQSPMYIATTSI